MANRGGTVIGRRSASRWLLVGFVATLASLWLGTQPLTVLSAGDTDETNCGDAWGPLRDALPTPCYSTFYWSGWVARIGLVVGIALLIVGAALWIRGRRNTSP